MIARTLILGLLSCAIWVSAQAQTTLEDMVSQGNAGWMLGKWETSSGDGNTSLNFAWDLDKKVIVLHGKIGDMEFKGYSAIEPGTSEVRYVGFDTRGTVTRGSWGMESEELTLRIESKSEERTTKMAAVFTGSASDGLEVRLHAVNDSGSLATPARTTLKLKKAK